MRWISVLFVIVLAMLALPAVSAARLNVLVYGGSFDEGSDVTVSGSVMTLTGTAYSGSDDILLKLYEYDEGTTGTLLNTSAASISDSAFQTNPITGITAGTYLAVAVISGANQGNGRAIITIENQKFHEVITDRQTYSPGDNVTLTLSVTQEQNGSLAPVVSEDVILKIRKGDESTEEIMNTDVDGSATLVYNVPSTNSGYGDYVIDVANQPSQAFFSVPFFNIKSAVINSDDVDDLRSNSESVFSGDDVIVARIVASKETSSGGKEPVAGMDITARLIKLSDYSTKKTWLPMDFTEDNGVYTSSNFSLSALTQGENYVLEVEAEKGIIKNDARYFRIQNYDLVFTPIFDENVNVLVAGDTMSYGVNMVDLTTGEGIPVGKYDDVDLITCRDSRGADCSSQVSNLQLEDSDNPDYRKILSFTVGSSGDYMLELKVNTTDYKSVKEIISLYVDDFAVYADTSSVYDIPKKDFSSGANVNLKTFAFLSEMAEANIEQTRVLWVKDSDGADVTEDMFPAGTSRTVSSDAVSAYAPQTSGCYDVGLEITTSNGTAETSTSLCVKKYDIWADPYRCDNNDWSWEFSSEDDACLHLYIVDSWGNQPDPDDVTTKVTQLTNMMTGETFTVSSSSNGTDDSRRPVVQLDLANYPDLSSGFYMASLEVTEKSSGSTEEGSGFFQISNFDVSLVTQSQDTGFQNYQFDSEGGIQIEVSTSYFNGTNIQGANVSLERLVVMSANSFQELSTDNYDVSAIALTDGDGTTSFTLNPASGESWPKGDYLAFVNVNEGGSTQMSQVWYMVRSMDAYAITSRMSAKYSPEETVSFDVSVTDLDYNGIENANVTLLDIYNLDSDSLVSGVAAVSAQTDSWGYASVSFSAPLDPGDYFAIFSATHPTTGDSETVYGWFRVLNGGYVLDATLKYASESVVTPGGNVNYVVTVKDQDGQGVAYRNVTFYKLVNIDEFPHEESEPTILTEGVTDSEGSADVILTAPRTEGHWIPLLNIDGINITDESIVQHFDTKYINLEVFLQDNDSIIQNTFAPLSPVVVNVSLQNPSGGDIDMTSLTLVDYFFPRLRRTNTLGAAITEGFEDYNSLSFTAPEATGNYILHIRSVDGSANRKLISVPFEVGNQFSYSVYLESFEFGISEQIPIQFSVTGGPAKVQLMSVRDTFEGIVVENESSASAPVSDSTIEYSVGPIAAIGDYELELCIFTGSSCNDDSDREFRMVSIESDYFVNAWPDRVSGMYTSEEGATINLELLDSSQTPTAFDSVDVLSVIEQSTGNDVVGSTIATPAGDTVNLEISQPGDYRATIRLEKSGQWYEVDVWFMIEDYRLNVITDDTGFDYGVGIPITFNISGFGNESGKLYIMDEHNNWEVISRYTQNFSLSDGRAQVDINIDEPGWYVATAAIPSLTVSDRKESHYTFSTGAGFEAYLDYASINNQFSPGEDVVLEFDMFVGGPHDGSVNITVDIRNPHNWEIINESIFDSSVGVTSGQGSVNLTDHGLLDGEYVAEIEFSYGGESVYADYWFRIAGRELYIHTTEWNYDVGDSVVINTELYDGGIVQEGVNITIENITRSGEAVNVTYNTKTDTTDSNGEATVSFDLPKESGKYKVEISENDQDLRRFITISTQGYNVWVDKPAEDWDKWAYHVSDEFRLELRVNDKDWNGVENVSVEYTIRDVDDDWNIVTGPVDAGATDVNGYKEVSWTVTQSGNYFMEIDVDDGSFTEGRSFSVVAFDYFSYLRGEVGETTYSDWEIPDFAIVVLIADVMSGDTPVEGALVELVEVRNLMDWSEENATVIQGSAVTNSEGRAKLKIQAEGLSQGSDFIMRYNISSGNETAEGEAWFRIVDYTFNAELTYPQTLNDTTGYITTSKGPGEMAFIIVNYTGSTDNDERVCIDDIRRWDGYRNYVGQCYTITNGSMTINFTTPTESGGYDVIVVLVSGGDGSTMQGEWKEDRWLWFDVSGGAEANWEVNVWSEGGPNAWTGQPKTFRYEMFNRQNWMSNSNISGTCGNINITEIRNSQTWEEEIYDDLNIRFE
ncbi:hypothetical protein HQ545_07700 [Candidatus Woesearchaeota archaeon]|nr:hypothetical protein [Candidatus Woesearchaeota archaeon]